MNTDRKKELSIVTFLEIFSWILVISITGVLYSVLQSTSFHALRELVAAVAIIYPLKSLYPLDNLSSRFIEFLKEKKIPLIASAAIILFLFGIYEAGIYVEYLGYYGIVHSSITSIFLKAQLLYTGIFGSKFSELLYLSTVIYTEILITYILFDQVYSGLSGKVKKGE